MSIDDGIVKVVQSYGIKVDAERLNEALRFDRSSYERGFIDGMEQAAKNMHGNKPNAFIRAKLSSSGITGKEVADEIGIHEGTFSRILREELSDEKKLQIMNAIERIEFRKSRR